MQISGLFIVEDIYTLSFITHAKAYSAHDPGILKHFICCKAAPNPFGVEKKTGLNKQ